MRHIQNDYMKVQLQNALLAQEVAESAKIRQAERARAQAAEAVENLPPQNDEPGIKKVPGKPEEGKGGTKGRSQAFSISRYQQNGVLEEGGGPGEETGQSSTRHIDIKV